MVFCAIETYLGVQNFGSLDVELPSCQVVCVVTCFDGHMTSIKNRRHYTLQLLQSFIKAYCWIGVGPCTNRELRSFAHQIIRQYGVA